VLVSHIEWISRPEVADPLMICSFGGWNDGGEAATMALQHLKERWAARRFAGLNPEEFYDFQVHRPIVRLKDGVTRQIEWPTNDFFHAKAGDRDVVLFIGLEPNTRWRAYCDALLGVGRELGAGLLATLGAFLADVPHTIPAPVNVASADPAWRARPGIMPARYEGPTGIVGVLHEAAERAGLPSIAGWAASPHYLPAEANPNAARSLLVALRDLLELDIDTRELEAASSGWRQRVDDAIAQDESLSEYVRRLEEAASTAAPGETPSGEDLAAELERFLRDREDE
jgi:proteasome assembly chaperone (PAC2) family protein